MDLPNRRGVPNGGVADAEETTRMANHHPQEDKDEGLVSSLLTKLDALENGADSDTVEKSNHEQPEKEEPQLAAIAKDLRKIKRQNTITHVLLGTVVLMTAVWQVNEVSFLLWLQRKLSNPLKSLGDFINPFKGRRPPVIESSPLPIPDVTQADLPTLVISGDHT